MSNSPCENSRFRGMKVFFRFSLLFAVAVPVMARDLPPAGRQFLEQYCVECHDADTTKGGLDLTALRFDPANSTNFSKWVLLHDRVSNGEMPPKKKARPDSAAAAAFIKSLASALTEAEEAKDGRATQRRLNR